MRALNECPFCHAPEAVWTAKSKPERACFDIQTCRLCMRSWKFAKTGRALRVKTFVTLTLTRTETP